MKMGNNLKAQIKEMIMQEYDACEEDITYEDNKPYLNFNLNDAAEDLVNRIMDAMEKDKSE